MTKEEFAEYLGKLILAFAWEDQTEEQLGTVVKVDGAILQVESPFGDRFLVAVQDAPANAPALLREPSIF